MIPPSMETLLFVVSGVLAFVGVIYWLWSHLQLTQKKVQLLENAVFELREMIPATPVRPPECRIGSSCSDSKPASPPDSPLPPPLPKYKDLEEDWADVTVSAPVPFESDEVIAAVISVVDASQNVSTIEEKDNGNEKGSEKEIEKEMDLSPAPYVNSTTSFSSASSVVSSATVQNPLEGLPLKELRRMGEQKGIIGAVEMRKKELLVALREITVKSFNVPEEPAPSGSVIPPQASSGISDEAEILE